MSRSSFPLPMPSSLSTPRLCTLTPTDSFSSEVIVSLAVVLGYMMVLYWGAMIAPGIGVSGHLLVTIPWNLVDWAHAPAFGLLAWLFAAELEWRDWPLVCALPVASTAAWVFGLWTEVFQASVPGRHLSVEDLIVDAIGIACAAMLIVMRQGARSARLVPACTRAEIQRYGTGGSCT